jgi:hypothetical protein
MDYIPTRLAILQSSPDKIEMGIISEIKFLIPTCITVKFELLVLDRIPVVQIGEKSFAMSEVKCSSILEEIRKKQQTRSSRCREMCQEQE